MNRRTPLLGAVALLAVLTGLAGPTATAAQDAGWQRLGEVRNDTLYVGRDQVIDLALERNEMLAASGAMTDAAAADAMGAWRAFLPQVRVSEFFLRSDDALSSFGFKLQNRGVTQADFNPLLLNAPGETNNFITRLEALIPVFNGGSGLNGKRAADAMSRAAGHRHVRATETVRFHAVQAFEGLALAAAYEQVMLAAVASAEGHVARARSFVENEMATAADLLQAEVFLAGLRQQLIQVRNLKAVAGENIKLLTAVDTALPLAAASDQAAAPATLDADPARAGGRSDILARRAEAEAAGRMVGVARGNMLPHLNAGVQRDLYSHDNLFGSDAKSWSLGVYATWDIFRGLQNVAELRKAKAHRRAAEHMADFETRQARVQATEALLNLEAARQKVAVATDAVAAAREGLRIVSNQYREGLAGMVDLLDTQAAATAAEGHLVQALHDYRVGLANLEFTGAVRSDVSPAAGQ